MIHEIEIFLPSTNKKNQLHVVIWEPKDTPVKCILQLSHGMIDHIYRYKEFASYLAARGVLVIGNDHLGHGKTVKSSEEFGYFDAEDGSKTVVDDLHTVTRYAKEKYPNLPYFLLGHSMGSFIARRYLMTYGKELDGAIIMATGQFPVPLVNIGLPILQILKKLKGSHYRSKLLNKLVFSSFNKQFKPTQTEYDWLSKNKASIDAYRADPLCNYIFTLNGYETLLRSFDFIGRKSNIRRIPKNLPIFFVVGSEDPLSQNGKIVTKIFHQYKALGIQNIKLNLYPSDRHELLQELDRHTIFEEIYGWIMHEMKH